MRPTTKAGTAIVRVLRGSHLRAADRGGKSDPYCVLQSAGGQKVKTSVKKGTLHPEWDESLELSVSDSSALIFLEVWDHDMIGRHDSLGAGEIPLAQCTPFESTPLTIAVDDKRATIDVDVTWLPTEPEDEVAQAEEAAATRIAAMRRGSVGRRDVQGKRAAARQAAAGLERSSSAAVLSTSSRPPAAALSKSSSSAAGLRQSSSMIEPPPPPSTTTTAAGTASVTVRVLRGANLVAADRGGKSDPYVVVQVPGGKKGKTRVIKGTVNPVWDPPEVLELAVPDAVAAASHLTVEVWDHDRIGFDDLLGRGKLVLAGCTPHATTPLTIAIDRQGTIDVEVTWRPAAAEEAAPAEEASAEEQAAEAAAARKSAKVKAKAAKEAAAREAAAAEATAAAAVATRAAQAKAERARRAADEAAAAEAAATELQAEVLAAKEAAAREAAEATQAADAKEAAAKEAAAREEKIRRAGAAHVSPPEQHLPIHVSRPLAPSLSLSLSLLTSAISAGRAEMRMSASDLPANHASRHRQLEEWHDLIVHVEHCIALRPSQMGTLRGSTERYASSFALLREAVLQHVLVGSAGGLVLEANNVAYRPQPSPWEQTLPSQMGFPRVGSFEVSVQLTDTRFDRTYGPVTVHSKLGTFRFPSIVAVTKRLHAQIAQWLLLPTPADPRPADPRTPPGRAPPGWGSPAGLGSRPQSARSLARPQSAQMLRPISFDSPDRNGFRPHSATTRPLDMSADMLVGRRHADVYGLLQASQDDALHQNHTLRQQNDTLIAEQAKMRGHVERVEEQVSKMREEMAALRSELVAAAKTSGARVLNKSTTAAAGLVHSTGGSISAGMKGIGSGLSKVGSSMKNLTGGGGGSSSGAAPPEGLATVRVIRGAHLLAADRGGTSDPYVVVHAAGGRKAKTSVQKGTVHPLWNETLEVGVLNHALPLALEVWDHDKVGFDDSLGRGEVSLALLTPGEATLLTVTLDKQGSIDVEVTWQPPRRRGGVDGAAPVAQSELLEVPHAAAMEAAAAEAQSKLARGSSTAVLNKGGAAVSAGLSRVGTGLGSGLQKMSSSAATLAQSEGAANMRAGLGRMGTAAKGKLGLGKGGSGAGDGAGTATVRVLRGSGLLAGDKNGKSDPFVVLKCGDGKKAKTAVRKATLEPTWDDETHEMHISDAAMPLAYPSATGGAATYSSALLFVEVWDHDTIGRNDWLGEGEIPVTAPHTPTLLTIALDTQGTIDVEVTWRPRSLEAHDEEPAAAEAAEQDVAASKLAAVRKGQLQRRKSAGVAVVAAAAPVAAPAAAAGRPKRMAQGNLAQGKTQPALKKAEAGRVGSFKEAEVAELQQLSSSAAEVSKSGVAAGLSKISSGLHKMGSSMASGLGQSSADQSSAAAGGAVLLESSAAIRVVRGTDLLAADKGGTSDPYVVIKEPGGKKVRTAVQKATLNPSWNELLELPIAFSPTALPLEVWDHDRIGFDDSLGVGEIDLTRCAPGEPTPLTITIDKKGTVDVVVTYRPAELPELPLPPPPPPPARARATAPVTAPVAAPAVAARAEAASRIAAVRKGQLGRRQPATAASAAAAVYAPAAVPPARPKRMAQGTTQPALKKPSAEEAEAAAAASRIAAVRKGQLGRRNSAARDGKTPSRAAAPAAATPAAAAAAAEAAEQDVAASKLAAVRKGQMQRRKSAGAAAAPAAPAGRPKRVGAVAAQRPAPVPVAPGVLPPLSEASEQADAAARIQARRKGQLARRK